MSEQLAPESLASPGASAASTSAAIADLEGRHTSGVYPKRSIALAHGLGAEVWDAEGVRYLDFSSGHGVAALGHAHPGVRTAVDDQLAAITTCPETFPNEQRARYAAELTEVLPGELERVFFCNSGAEAVEAAIKFARLATGRTEVVAFARGFHGRTYGALSATWNPRLREPFAPLVPGFAHVPVGDRAALEDALTEEVACLLVEVVQGEGGVRLQEAGDLAHAARVCRERGVLLVVDEVQTGFGRTGRLFACEHFGLEPDLLCLGKAMAGGLPMGGVALGPRVGELPRGAHGTTFGGGPVVCAAARATLEALRTEELAAQAEALGRAGRERLEGAGLIAVREVRGLGLMIGLELRGRVQPVLEALLAAGLLALPAGTNVLRLLPPLVISRAQFDEGLQLVERVLASPIPRARRGA